MEAEDIQRAVVVRLMDMNGRKEFLVKRHFDDRSSSERYR
jgi:hypothetical protein